MHISSPALRIALAILLGVHGAICVLGFVKAFALARVEALTAPIPRPLGVLWLLAAIGFAIAAVLVLAAPPRWWLAAAPAVVLSQLLIFAAWKDARKPG